MTYLLTVRILFGMNEMPTPSCPAGHGPMTPGRRLGPSAQRCRTCDGLLISAQDLRAVIAPAYVRGLWKAARNSAPESPWVCPHCGAGMVTARPWESDSAPVLAVCTPCQSLWCEAAQFAKLPQLAERELPRVRQRTKQEIREEKAGRSLGEITEWGAGLREREWRKIPALLGYPVKETPEPLARRPWAMWGYAAILLVVFVFELTDPEGIIGRWGLVPAERWRFGGFTFLTSGLLHGGLWHILGNLYFLFLVGDCVESDLGPWRFVLMLVLATLLGSTLHTLGHLQDTTPCIGASDAISAAIAFHALAFPHARFGYAFGFWPLYIRVLWLPARIAFFLWVVYQLFGAWVQLHGNLDVSFLAHVGGALVGVAFWVVVTYVLVED